MSVEVVLGGEPQLFVAARAGSAAEVEAALDGGAGVDARDPWGLTALHSAAIGGHAEVVSVLLRRGAAVEARNGGGKSALHVAASAGQCAVVSVLLARRADVLARTPYGSAPLELAREHAPGGPCEQLIREELRQRLARADDTERELQQRVAFSGAMLRDLRMQLGAELASAPELGASHAEAEHPGQSAGGYWALAARTVADMRAQTFDALSRTWVREQPHGVVDAFPWSGELVSTGVLPSLDPEDKELAEGFYKLQLSVEYTKRCESRRGSERAAAREAEAERLLEEETGRTSLAWEELVQELSKTEGSWDWSRVEVRPAEPPGLPTGAGATPAAHAAGPAGGGEGPVFRRHEVIGPLGGVVRRRVCYERLHYPHGSWMLHDPLAYEFRLRADTPELRVEPLVLDLPMGGSANRLRHLADARPDPLGLRAMAEAPGPAGVFASSPVALPRRKYGGAMPRVRSRPSSPAHGDGGAAASAEVEAAAAEARSKAAAVAAEVETAEAAAREAAAAAANVRIVEVHVDEWPYAFAVATRDIAAGELLAVDRGEEHWAMQRATLARLWALARVGRDLVVGVDVEEEAHTAHEEAAAEDPEGALVLKPRAPMKRAFFGQS